MNRSLSAGFAVAVIGVLLVLLGSPFYTVKENSQVVITRFGEPIGKPITKAGLHIKTPFVEDVNRFEKRILEWDGDPNQIPTKDKRFIWIDTTARWQISDPLKFLQSVGNETGAQARLDDILDSITRDVITEQPLIEIVRSTNREVSRIFTEGEVEDSRLAEEQVIKIGRDKLMMEIQRRAKTMTPIYGIELIDVRIKRVIYIDDVLQKIYERMISERMRAAEQFKSEGLGRQAEIEGKTDKDLNQIESEAYRQSEEIKGKGDAEAARIYAEAYSKDPDFYSFLKTLETYKRTIDEKSTLVLSTDSEYFSLLNNSENSSLSSHGAVK